MIEAVIFDLDDTLYEEKQFVMSGFKAVSEYLSKKHSIPYKEIINILKQDFEKGLRKRNFNVLLEKIGLKNEELDNLTKVYREHQPSISLFPDTKVLLNNLKGKFKFGIITDGHIITQKNKISALGIGNYFTIITINNIAEGETKENEKSFLHTLSQLKISPGNALYIGDNPSKDFAAAKKLGMHTIRIRRNKGEYNNIIVDKSSKADHTISTLLDLPKIIEKSKGNQI